MATLYENWTVVDFTIGFFGATWAAQTFTPSISHSITSVKLYLKRRGTSSDGVITVSIRETDGSGKPTGSDLTSGTINRSDAGATGSWIEIVFTSSYSLLANTKYAIVVRDPTGDTNDCIEWGYDTFISGGYTGGQRVTSGDSGATWSAPSNTVDWDFEEWGDPTFVPQVIMIV